MTNVRVWIYRKTGFKWGHDCHEDVLREGYSKLANENMHLRSQVSVRDDLIAALRIDVARGGHR